MRSILVLCVLLAGYVCWQHFSLQKSEEKNQQLQQQNILLQQSKKDLTEKLEAYNDRQQKANRQIAKLKTKALRQEDDCYNRPLPDAYIEFVRQTDNPTR